MRILYSQIIIKIIAVLLALMPPVISGESDFTFIAVRADGLIVADDSDIVSFQQVFPNSEGKTTHLFNLMRIENGDAIEIHLKPSTAEKIADYIEPYITAHAQGHSSNEETIDINENIQVIVSCKNDFSIILKDQRFNSSIGYVGEKAKSIIYAMKDAESRSKTWALAFFTQAANLETPPTSKASRQRNAKSPDTSEIFNENRKSLPSFTVFEFFHSKSEKNKVREGDRIILSGVIFEPIEIDRSSKTISFSLRDFSGTTGAFIKITYDHNMDYGDMIEALPAKFYTAARNDECLWVDIECNVQLSENGRGIIFTNGEIKQIVVRDFGF